ncbi:MAG: hypothetical protein ACPG6V_07770 [Flavobacteriales bacterium]
MIVGTNNAIRDFIHILDTEFGKQSIEIYELNLTKKTRLYRLKGIDLVFELENTSLVFVQIGCSD